MVSDSLSEGREEKALDGKSEDNILFPVGIQKHKDSHLIHIYPLQSPALSIEIIL